MAELGNQNARKTNELLMNQNDTLKDITKEYKFQADLNKALLDTAKEFLSSTKKRFIGEKSIKELLEDQATTQQHQKTLWNTSMKMFKDARALEKSGKIDDAIKLRNQAQLLRAQGQNIKILATMSKYVGGIAKHWLWIKTAAVFIYGWWRKVDEANSNFRIQMGMWEKSVIGIQRTNRQVLSDLMHANVSLEEIYAATKAVGESFGSVRYASADVTANLAYWQQNLGLGVKEGAEVLRIFSSISGTTADSNTSMVNFVQSMTEAAGVPLNQTMQDIATASKTSYSMMSRSPLALAKAAVEARRLGSSLDAMAKSGRQLLDFTDSINAEMNASVLIGKAVNFQRARELAYRRDQVGFQKEMMRLATEEVDFNKLDVFQQEAFAKALGKSADEISRMITARNQERWIMANGTQEQREQLANLRKLEAANESIANEQGKQAEKMMMQRANQAKMVQLTNTWNQLLFQLAEVFIPIANVLGQIAILGLRILSPIIKATVALTGLWKILQWVFGAVFKTGTLLTKWIPILGVIVNVISGIVYAWGDLVKLWNDWQAGVISFPALIGKGLLAIGKGIFDSLIWPFKAVFNWLEDTFLGKSPSKIGLMIVAGLKAVGRMMFNNIIAPFRLARWAISKLFGGKPIMASVETPATAAAGAEASGMVKGAAAEANVAKVEENRMEATEKLLGVIANSINGLRDDLTSGKVITNIDSQLVSTISYRQTLFRKGYGTNQAVA